MHILGQICRFWAKHPHFYGRKQTFCTFISENHLHTSLALVFGQAWDKMDQKGYMAKNAKFDLVCLSNVVDVNRNKMIKRFLAFRTDFVQVFLFSLTSRIFRPSQILHFTANEDGFLRKENFKLLNQ